MRALTAHAREKGAQLFAAYGPSIGWGEVCRILADRRFVRHACKVEFSVDGLEPGEFAFAVARGGRPEDGFVMRVHPVFQHRLDDAAVLVLYQLAVVNYGELASDDGALAFCSASLGLDEDACYERIRGLAEDVVPR